MDEWDRIRRFFLEERSAEVKGEKIFVTVPFSAHRSQLVSVHLNDKAEVAVESPVACISELETPLAEVLSLVGRRSRFGLRVKDGYMTLITHRHVAQTDPGEIDDLVYDLGTDADMIEMDLSPDDEDDGF